MLQEGENRRRELIGRLHPGASPVIFQLRLHQQAVCVECHLGSSLEFPSLCLMVFPGRDSIGAILKCQHTKTVTTCSVLGPDSTDEASRRKWNNWKRQSLGASSNTPFYVTPQTGDRDTNSTPLLIWYLFGVDILFFLLVCLRRANTSSSQATSPTWDSDLVDSVICRV